MKRLIARYKAWRRRQYARRLGMELTKSAYRIRQGLEGRHGL